ncbi:PD-(D/E)XK motif protein [Isoptericola sp. NPDC055881]
MTETQSFEWLRAAIEQQPRSKAERGRTIVWADSHKSLGLARDPSDTIEVFVVGPRLLAGTTAVSECLSHQTWTTSDGADLEANRLVLPDAANLPGVAAFVCAELLANCLETDPQTAFTATEPVIMLLLREAEVGNQVRTGLAGELLALEALTRHSTAPDQVVDSWFGYGPSSRDLQLGPVGIEVKTTTTSSSTHIVQGFHQVEVGHPATGEPETRLYVLSVGIRWLAVDSQVGRTIPSLVDSILGRLSTDAVYRFLARLRQYGGDAGTGYDHERDRERLSFARPWFATFERLYDMTDERVRVMRSKDVEGITHIDPASVTFQIRLPEQVDGNLNPVSGIEQIASRLTNGA